MSKESKIILGIILLIVLASGILVAFVNGQTDNSGVVSERLVREDSHRRGTGNVQLVEFGDYQCPACGQVNPIVERLFSEFGDRVTFIFRNLPLPQIHNNAFIAAEAAEAAADQGKFWEMNKKLYDTQEVWSIQKDPTETFVGYAEDLKLDVAKFRNSIENKLNRERIDRDQSDAYALGVRGTPTFFVNGEQVKQSDYDSLKKAIETALATKG